MYDICAMAPLNDAQRKEFEKLIDQLERIRTELNWPQEKIASLCGVQQSTYARWVLKIKGKTGGSEPTELIFLGLKAKTPELIAELEASRKMLDKLLKEIESLRKER